MRIGARIFVFCLTAGTSSGVLQAQGTLTGQVRDLTGRPLVDAPVALDIGTDSTRVTRTDRQGRFRFTRVSEGRHILRTAMIGYQPDDAPIFMPEGNHHVEIVLEPLAQRLDTLRVVATRRGIYGTTITPEGSGPLGGVHVELMGTRYNMRTKADGRFEFPEVREAGYVVAARKDHYQTRLVSVLVPPSGAVELALVLDTLATRQERRYEVLLRDMKSRIIRRSVNTSALVSAQELAATPGFPLHMALRYAPSVYGKGLTIMTPDRCKVYIDGVAARMGLLLRDINADDVMMVEVYGGGGGCGAVYVWLKR